MGIKRIVLIRDTYNLEFKMCTLLQMFTTVDGSLMKNICRSNFHFTTKPQGEIRKNRQEAVASRSKEEIPQLEIVVQSPAM